MTTLSARQADAWPIEFYGKASDLVEALSSADPDSAAFNEIKSRYWAMNEVRLSEDEKWAFFPFAAADTHSEPPATLNDMRRDGPGVVLLRVIPDEKGINQWIYLRLHSPDSSPVKVMPANEIVLQNPMVQRAISKSVDYGTRRCLRFVRENERAAAKGLYPKHTEFVFESCRMGSYGAPIDANIVNTATFVAQVGAGTQHFVIIMNQDLVAVVRF